MGAINFGCRTFLFLKKGYIMECENFLCIYQEDGKCTLDSISLGIMGECQECIYVNIEPELLKDLKKKHLERLSE